MSASGMVVMFGCSQVWPPISMPAWQYGERPGDPGNFVADQEEERCLGVVVVQNPQQQPVRERRRPVIEGQGDAFCTRSPPVSDTWRSVAATATPALRQTNEHHSDSRRIALDEVWRLCGGLAEHR